LTTPTRTSRESLVVLGVGCPFEVLAGIVVSGTTIVFNAGLARSTFDELWRDSGGLGGVGMIASLEALVNCALGVMLSASVIALVLRSRRALDLHRDDALCKLALLPVALYGLWITDPRWRKLEVRLTMLSCVVAGAMYPVIVLLRLWLAGRAAKSGRVKGYFCRNTIRPLVRS
jgi:hypothetical protein